MCEAIERQFSSPSTASYPHQHQPQSIGRPGALVGGMSDEDITQPVEAALCNIERFATALLQGTTSYGASLHSDHHHPPATPTSFPSIAPSTSLQASSAGPPSGASTPTQQRMGDGSTQSASGSPMRHSLSQQRRLAASSGGAGAIASRPSILSAARIFSVLSGHEDTFALLRAANMKVVWARQLTINARFDEVAAYVTGGSVVPPMQPSWWQHLLCAHHALHTGQLRLTASPVGRNPSHAEGGEGGGSSPKSPGRSSQRGATQVRGIRRVACHDLSGRGQHAWLVGRGAGVLSPAGLRSELDAMGGVMGLLPLLLPPSRFPHTQQPLQELTIQGVYTRAGGSTRPSLPHQR